jgi:hypothetical protein
MEEVSPGPIMNAFAGHMSAKYLFAGVELGLFAALADGAQTQRQIAERVGLPDHGTRIVLDALVAVGFLERAEDLYRNSEVARAFLSGAGPADLSPMVKMWNDVVYDQWRSLSDSVRTDRPGYGYDDFTPTHLETFTVGVEVLTAPTAEALAAAYEFSSHRSLLDLAGGTGSFVLAAQRRHPLLRGAIL